MVDTSRRHRLGSLLGTACLLVPTAAQNAVVETVMMPMRDGVKLRTILQFPAVDGVRMEGRFPVVLARTPYGAGASGFGASLARAGYVHASQDVRGRGGSEGEFYIYVNEGEDGYDAVEWLAAQPWCNGKVGTHGGSYLAATQNALAVLRPPHLEAMFITVGTSNYKEDGAGRGGAFALLHNLIYCMSLAGIPSDEPALLRAAPGCEAEALAPRPTYQQWYADWRAHPTYDAYWQQNGYNFEERFDQYPDVPIYLVGGWYDIFKRGTLNLYQGLRSRNTSTRLVMGAWTHGVGGTGAGAVSYGDDASFSVSREMRRWFDRFLMGKENGVDQGAKVRYFVMGGGGPARWSDKGKLLSGGVWREASTWPPPESEPLQLYLAAEGTLSIDCPIAGKGTIEFDPKNPVPSIGGNIDTGAHLVPHGPRQQVFGEGRMTDASAPPLTERDDVLVFQTAPLAYDVEASGPMSATLFVASSAVDTDFTAKLIDVAPPNQHHPDGYPINIEDGILRMRYRNSMATERLMEPGEIYEVTIDLWATSHCIRKGHRIRLDISSSNFPFYDVNPNTGEPLGRHTRMETATNTVHFGGERPSRLHLTVRPTH